MSVGHYENFPVASLALPARLRAPIAVIYRFARSADDFADEGDAAPETRLAELDAYRRSLDEIASHRAPKAGLFADLQQVIQSHSLPMAPFYDLLDAFSQDVVKSRYADFAELLDYCRRSANPVGTLMLHLYQAATIENLRRSDAICTALQLINFWQDVRVDHEKNRVYLPQEDLERFGVSEGQIAAGQTDEHWRALMQFQVARSRTMLESGAPLVKALSGRISFELRMIVQGGSRILQKLDQVRGDVFRRRPTLRALDWPLIAWRGLRM